MQAKKGCTILLVGQITITLILLVISLRQGISLQADMLTALPESNFDKPILHAEKQLFNRASSHVVISFSGSDKEQAYQDFLPKIIKHGWQAQLPDTEKLNQLANFYVDYAGYLLSEQYSTNIADEQRFRQYFTAQMSQFSNPLLSQTFEKDPSLATANFIDELIAKQSNLQTKNGYFFADHVTEKPIVLMLDVGLKEEASQGINFAISTRNTLLALIAANKQAFPEVAIELSGILMHSAENAEQAKWEMSFFGTLSLMATILLVVFVFRSMTPLIWIVLTVSNALLMGFTCLVWVFESVHIITLVFGTTLIGLGVDYCLHVLAHKTFARKTSITNTILFAFLTTVLSYSLLFLTPLAILKQVAVFVCSGLFAALIVSLWLEKTGMLRLKMSGDDIAKVNSTKHLKAVMFIGRKLAVVITGLLVIYSVVKPLSFDDSIAKLNASSAELVAAEQYHRSLLGFQDKSRIFVYANSLQQLLEKEERLAQKIQTHLPNTTITKLSDWLPSAATQKQNITLFEQAHGNKVYLAVQEFLPEYRFNQPAKLLTLEDLVAVTGQQLVNAKYVTYQDFHVSLIEVNSTDTAQLGAIIDDSENVALFDKQRSLSKVLSSFRIELSYWLVAAIVAILAMLYIRFKWHTTVVASYVILASLNAALALACLIQGSLNVFNLLSAILVIGLAVDYLIFYREKEFSDANVIAISLSAASSFFVFGMLAFSQTPAVQSFGITVTIGLLLIYLLAPLVVKGRK
ncbi:MMPL family transporter [Thalassotalea sp. PLHSN55]|uniref:MMPL family transporter n=1 Tax=Thalassotalea sp. PLHSN55 TaxID=3435888 RepID=UPI003F82D54E